MLKRLVNEARFTLNLTTTGPVLVRSGYATMVGPDMTPVLTFRNGEQQVYFPGSSLKGVLRSHLEKVSRTLNQKAVCDPFHVKGQTDEFCGKKLEGREDVDSITAYRDSCPICRLFGSTEFIGRINMNDAYLAEGMLNPRPTEVRDGVGIDRLTGGAAYGAKFDLEAVSAGVTFTTDVYLRNFETWQLGMLLAAVQDFEDGLIRIGSGTSRGLGSVKGSIESVLINHLGAIAQKPATEVWGLGKLLTENEGDYGTQADDILTVEHPPVEAQRGIRRQATFAGDSLIDLRAAAIQTFVTRLQAWPAPTEMQMR